MKSKKFLLSSIFLVLTIIAYIVASFVFCYTTKPAVREGEFPFSITYEYKGEQKTLSGVLKCEFSGSRTILGEHQRHWNEEIVFDNPENVEYPFVVEQNEKMSLAIQEHMYGGYFMGDPLHSDYYEKYGNGEIIPYVEYYDYVNDITLDEENKDEILESLGFRFIEYSYPEPIENSFSVSGVLYSGDNVNIFVMIMLVFLILCLIFVRKEKDIEYSTFDKIGIVLNFVIGIVVLPFITLVCILHELIGGGADFLSQFTFTIPPLAILCLALSIVFRRKGYKRWGFFTQFGGSVLFVLSLLMDTIL